MAREALFLGVEMAAMILLPVECFVGSRNGEIANEQKTNKRKSIEQRANKEKFCIEARAKAEKKLKRYEKP